MFRHSPEHPLSAMFRSFVHSSTFYVQLFCCTGVFIEEKKDGGMMRKKQAAAAAAQSAGGDGAWCIVVEWHRARCRCLGCHGPFRSWNRTRTSTRTRTTRVSEVQGH